MDIILIIFREKTPRSGEFFQRCGKCNGISLKNTGYPIGFPHPYPGSPNSLSTLLPHSVRPTLYPNSILSGPSSTLFALLPYPVRASPPPLSGRAQPGHPVRPPTLSGPFFAENVRPDRVGQGTTLSGCNTGSDGVRKSSYIPVLNNVISWTNAKLAHTVSLESPWGKYVFSNDYIY